MQSKKKKSLGNVPPSQAAQELKDEILNKCRLLATGKSFTAQPIVSLTRELIELEKTFSALAPKSPETEMDITGLRKLNKKPAKVEKPKRVKRAKRRRGADEEDF
jgi:hypothetical protein